MADRKTVKIGDLFDLEKGELQSTKCTPGKYNFLTAAEEWKTHNDYTHDCEALVFAAAASGSLGRTHYVNAKFVTSDLCFILTPKDSLNYPIHLPFYHFVFSAMRNEIVSQTKSGTSKESISQRSIKAYELPYFDIDLQKQWIGRLLTTKASVAELDTEITNQQTLLKKLRQSILQDAIQGKLTAEWRKMHPDTEPAATLLQRIQAEKQTLLATKKIRKQKPLPPINPKEIPFEIPHGWGWCQIGNISNISSGKGFKKSEYSTSGIRLFQIANVSIGKASWDTTVYVPKSYLEVHPELQLCKGDLVMALNRPLLSHMLKIAILTEQDVPAVLYQRVGRFDMIDRVLIPWLFVYLRSECFSGWLYDQIKGVNIPFVNQSKVHAHPIPLPPLAEQAAIVAQVEKLFGMLDELERQTTRSRTDSAALMASVLAAAFAPS